MKVKALPTDFGESGWTAVLSGRPQYPTVESSHTADWLIIGAGFTGLAAARRLSQLRPQDRILLLDAKRLADGPVGRNSGFMIDLPHHLSAGSYVGEEASHDAQQTALNRSAIQFVLDAAEEHAIGRHIINPCGKVNAAATNRGIHQNQAYAAQLDLIGEAHSLLSAGDMRALTGSDYYLGGLYTPGTVMLQPAAYVYAMAKALPPKVDVYEASPVIELTRSGEDWIAQTPKGKITAAKCILATNGHAVSFGYYEKQLVHIHLYASMSRALTEDEIKVCGGEREWGLTPSDPAGSTVRRIQTPDGDRIIVRNRIAYTPQLTTTDDKVTDFGVTQDASFRARFPMLPKVDMQYRWAGRLCLSRNEVPAFGEVEPNLYTACCQNGLGAAQGTLSGIAAAELASGETTERTRWFADQARPSKLPPPWLTQVGAAATIRWNEARAGRER